jgi:glycosyltransferase involved in cell wall biosynthesis
MVVSSIQPHKDNEVCLEALAHLRKTQPGIAWTMTFAGGQSVEQWAGLQRFAGELGVRDAVEFLGPVDKNRLADLLNTSLCLVSASRIESFCMVAVEAMAAGCPPVVANATSMPESVGDAALIVEPGSHEQFADAVSTLHHDRDAREALIQRGRRHIEKLHIEAFKRNVRTLVTELLAS